MAESTVPGGLGGDQTQSGEEQLQQKLTAADEQVMRGKVLADFMRDPDFAALARLKAAGKEFVISEKDQAQQQQQVPQEEEETPPEELMQNPKKFKGFMLNLITQAMKGQIDPINQRLQGVDKFMQDQTEIDAAQSVESMQKKYPDFNAHAKSMWEIHQKHPTMGAEELYFMAKAKSGQQIVTQQDIESERPSGTITRPPLSAQRKEPLPPGVQGLRMALTKAATANTAHVRDD